MVDQNRDWPSRRSLSDVAAIDGVRSVAVVDRLARATVWSVTFAPLDLAAEPGPTTETTDGSSPMRIADDVLGTVRAVELLAPEPAAPEGWFEVILIDTDHYHILCPFGPKADALVIELVLDARSANLAAARQAFSDLVAAHNVTVAARAGPAAPALSEPAMGPNGLPRRIATEPRAVAVPVQSSAGAEVDEGTLDRVAAALRTLK